MKLKFELAAHPVTLFLRAIQPAFRLAMYLHDLLCPRRRVAGVTLVDDCVDQHESGEEPLDRLESVWKLMRDIDPRRARLVQRHVDKISIDLIPGLAGQWHHNLRRCRISLNVLMKYPLETTASIIVHEITHARLLACGIGYGQSLRSRVERACDREQIRFLNRVPGAIETASAYEARLGHDGPTDDELVEYWVAELRALKISEPVIDRLLKVRLYIDHYRPQ